MGFNFTLTEAARTAGLDFFDLVGTTSIFSQLPALTALPGSATPVVTSVTVPADGGRPYILTVALTITNTSGWYIAEQYNVASMQTGQKLLSGIGNLASSNSNFVGLWDANTLLGTDDTIDGNSGNNLLRAYAGTNYVNGGAGTDTLLMPSPRSNYVVTKTATGLFVQAGNGSTTTTGIERLQFADQTVAYDTDGTAGQAYRLYQAAFNRTPDTGGLGFQTHALDGGQTLSQVAANFIASPEFNLRYGSLNDAAFVTQLYANVLHRAPDAGGLKYHVDNLGAGMARGDVLVGFSQSDENQAKLIGVISEGMVLTG